MRINRALNYGSIGSIIGHELTHGFDNTGMKIINNLRLKSRENNFNFFFIVGKEYDHTGLANPWWTNETMTEFNNRMQCFIDHYDHFQILKENQTEEELRDEDSEIAMVKQSNT